MAVNKEIVGKKDDAKHDGKRAEFRRIAEADDVITTFWNEWYKAKAEGILEDEAPFHPVPVEES